MNAPANEPSVASPAAPPVPLAFSGRILFADDDVQFRTGLQIRLKRAGFECDTVGAGMDALSLVQEQAYDVLLADIDMPGNQNLELLDALAKAAPKLPAILLTGRPTVDTAVRSIALKVAAYLVKPPDFDELCRVLATAIRQHRNERILTDSRSRLQDWEKEVARLQQLLEQSTDGTRQTAMRSYLRLTLRNLVVSLVELESLLVNDTDQVGAAQALEKQELVTALRKTVSVIERTRDHFKSKELGELRKELQGLLR